MFLLVYNLVRMTMLEAARRQQVAVERISFVDALRWLATAEPGDELPELVVNPHRPGRYEPRARKRRPRSDRPGAGTAFTQQATQNSFVEAWRPLWRAEAFGIQRLGDLRERFPLGA